MREPPYIFRQRVTELGCGRWVVYSRAHTKRERQERAAMDPWPPFAKTGPKSLWSWVCGIAVAVLVVTAACVGLVTSGLLPFLDDHHGSTLRASARHEGAFATSSSGGFRDPRRTLEKRKLQVLGVNADDSTVRRRLLPVPLLNHNVQGGSSLRVPAVTGNLPHSSLVPHLRTISNTTVLLVKRTGSYVIDAFVGYTL